MNRTRLVARIVLIAAAAFTLPAHAASPAAPAVSVHAGLKQLQFSWNRVPEATRYELWFYPTTGAAWVKHAELPRWRTSVAVNISAHLLHWGNARYVLKACNDSGCGRSPHLAVSHLMQQTAGFFKPPAQVARQQMGSTTDISENGNTLAAAIDTDESGGVEVFWRSSAGWVYETRLMADPKEQDLVYPPDPSIAVSGDGNVIALGVNVEIPPGGDPEANLNTGAVYVFRRGATGWTREQKLTFPDAWSEDEFGWRVDLDESGTLLAATRKRGDRATPGVGNNLGSVELFRHSSSGWAREASIPDGCFAIGLSGDGRTLVRSCGIVEVFTAPDWHRVASLPNELYFMSDFSIYPRNIAVSHDGRSFAVRSVVYDGEFAVSRASVNVYRLGASGWAREASLGPGDALNPGPEENPHGGYGLAVSMSRDGQFLAVGACELSAVGSGAIYPPGATGYGRGAVFIYQRKSAGWVLRQFLTPDANGYEQPLFGWSVSFGRNGKDLAVGAPWDGSSAAGVGGDPADESQPYRGAVWLY